MKNAIKYGVIIALLSAAWIFIMHITGHTPDNVTDTDYSWQELSSVIIPFFGLHFGIKSFRKQKGGELSFFEGVIEGIKIMLVGAVLAGAISFLYLSTFSNMLTVDYMERIFGSLVVGGLFLLINSLLLMTTPKKL